MSIASAILALSPTVYWKLDDPTGPAASDSSGNAHPGLYYGSFALSQSGPESGTESVLFNGGGGVRTASQSPVTTRPYAVLVWVAPQPSLATNGGAVYNGNGSIDGAGLVWAAPTAVAQPVSVLHGGQGQSGALGALVPATWHLLALSESSGGNTIAWVDNVQVFNTAGNNPIAPGTSSPFQANSPLASGAGFFAHAALFASVLTNANVNSVFTGVTGTLETPPSSALGDLALLNLIYAAVHRVFPTT